jgi:hypothetical protein
MLKSRLVTLDGRDAGASLRLIELPALLADRAARAALRAVDADPDGGVVALALQHTKTVRSLGPAGNDLLMPFVDGQVIDTSNGAPRAFNVAKDIRDWRNIERLQQAALLLHVGFLIGRQGLDVPVNFQAAQIMHGAPDISVTFCGKHIAAALESQLATYRECETVLSTEDIYNIVEILNVSALKEYHATQDR